MKSIFCLISVVVVLLTMSIYAEEVEITGFVDVLYQDQQEENSSFGMGAFEVDFASELSERICFEGAIVIEGGEVGLGQTILDIKLIGDDILGLQAGLIDIPFGLDYQVFATPDRKLISPPLITEIMMDGGWGDVGVNFYGAISLFDYNLYSVNGMGEDAGVPVSQESDNNNARTVGIRLEVTPIENFEIGVSYAIGPYLDENTEENLQRQGVHLQGAFGPVEAKGEYITGKEEIPDADPTEHSGYYIQGLIGPMDKFYGVIRYGEWSPKDGDAITRLSIGLGYDLLESVSIRTEYQMNSEEPEIDNNLICFQIVTSF